MRDDEMAPKSPESPKIEPSVEVDSLDDYSATSDDAPSIPDPANSDKNEPTMEVDEKVNEKVDDKILYEDDQGQGEGQDEVRREKLLMTIKLSPENGSVSTINTSLPSEDVPNPAPENMLPVPRVSQFVASKLIQLEKQTEPMGYRPSSILRITPDIRPASMRMTPDIRPTSVNQHPRAGYASESTDGYETDRYQRRRTLNDNPEKILHKKVNPQMDFWVNKLKLPTEDRPIDTSTVEGRIQLEQQAERRAINLAKRTVFDKFSLPSEVIKSWDKIISFTNA